MLQVPNRRVQHGCMSLTKLERRAQANLAFTPSAPIDDVRLFADRPEQSMQCIDAFFRKGRHIALYGERGVGKTSLANIIPKIIRGTNLPHLDAIRVDCNTEDSFNSIWRKIFRRLEMEIPPQVETSALDPIDPEELVYLLEKLPRQTLVVVDEFDRMENDEALSLLADTVKAFSDHALQITLMFVGVAGSLTNLLGEHESIIRSVEQVYMPRMSVGELTATLERGFGMIDSLSLSQEALLQIVSTAEGLPHYAHVLGSGSALATIEDDRTVVAEGDVARAEAHVIRTHSMVSDYMAATQSPQPRHLFEEVLLACAYAPRNSLGYFRPADVSNPLSRIVGRPMGIYNYARHLNELSGDRRHALAKEGEERAYVYRFRDPLLQPYVKMKARATGQIAPELIEELAAAQQALTAESPLDASHTPRLF